MKLPDTELKVMSVILDEEYLDENREIIASKVFRILQEKYGWNKSTVYTILGKLLDKELITRRYPSYTIKALITKDDLINSQLDSFIDIGLKKSPVEFFRGFLKRQEIDQKDLEEMKQILEELTKDKNKWYFKTKLFERNSIYA